MGIRSALTGLVGELKAAGFAATTEAELIDPNPLAVWVQPRSIGSVTLGGSGTLTVNVFLIVGNLDEVDVLRTFDDALPALLDLDAVALADEDPPIDLNAAVSLPHTTVPLPAIRVAVDLDISL